MKNLVALCAIALLTMTAACVRETPDADMVAATETTATDTSGTMASTTAASGGSVSSLTPAEKEFIAQAGESGLAEVRQSEVAQQRAQNAGVKSFAQRMIADHGRGNQELQQLATTKGAVLPTAINEQHQAAVSHLQGLEGAELDRMYMMHMADDHQKVVTLFENAERTVQDPDLKLWISKTLPLLREHLQHAQKLSASMQ